MVALRFRSRLLAAALTALACSGFVHAAEAPRAGLLGARYVGVGYGFVDLANTGYDARNYGFEYNHNLTPQLDARVEFDCLRSEGLGGVMFGGRHYSFKTLAAGARAFTDWNGAKAYVEAGAGYVWFRAPHGIEDNSWLWFAGAGVEFTVASRWALTPFVRYQDATQFESNSAWRYGLRANFALTERWGLSGQLERDDDQDMTYSLGANFRF